MAAAHNLKHVHAHAPLFSTRSNSSWYSSFRRTVPDFRFWAQNKGSARRAASRLCQSLTVQAKQRGEEHKEDTKPLLARDEGKASEWQLPQLERKDWLIAGAAFALIIIVPRILVLTAMGAEQAFVGLLLSFENAFIRLAFTGFRLFGTALTIIAVLTVLILFVRSKLKRV